MTILREVNKDAVPATPNITPDPMWNDYFTNLTRNRERDTLVMTAEVGPDTREALINLDQQHDKWNAPVVDDRSNAPPLLIHGMPLVPTLPQLLTSRPPSKDSPG